MIPINEDFAQQVASRLKRALIVDNITKGFVATGIYPINALAMESKMGPSETYSRAKGAANATESADSPNECDPAYQLEDGRFRRFLMRNQ